MQHVWHHTSIIDQGN